MTAMDTTDGVLMVKAYDWALLNPARRVFYNLATTGLSVLIALAIGTVQLMQLFVALARPKAPLLAAIASLDLGQLGYAIVALFVFAWLVSVALWRFGRAEPPTAHAHDHVHEDGTRHSHRHRH
jgi:high-affinity nickel-transport protein